MPRYEPLIISGAMVASMRRFARFRAPREACGVLFADRKTGDLARMAELNNVADHHLDFAFDPQEQLDVWIAEERAGRIPAVLWHSHPTSQLYPSPADQICMAMHASLTHVIVNKWTLRAFRWEGGVKAVDIRLAEGMIRI